MPLNLALGLWLGSGSGGSGAIVEEILDSYTTGLTGAFSFSRDLLSSFSSARQTNTAGAIDSWVNQTGNGIVLTGATTGRPTLAIAGPSNRACADFDGTDDKLSTSGGGGQQIANLFTNAAGWIAISFIADVIDANDPTVYSNECLVADHGGYMGLFLKTGDAVHSYNYDGTVDTNSTPITETAVHVVEWRHEGGNVYVRVDGGAEEVAASGNTQVMTGQLRIGSTAVSPSGATELNGKVFELITYSTVPSLADRNIIVANMKTWAGVA
jgi:hypothetical protein